MLETFVYSNIFRGCSEIMSAADGAGGWKMLTLADKEGKGIPANSDIGWQMGVGGLANADITDNNA